jgi:hypothetical protein
MTPELEWYVWREDFNRRQIVRFNVFAHGSFMEDLKKAARKYKDTEREQFEEAMRRSLMYYFWSKCEHEVVIDHWPPKHDDENWPSRKVDVYEQVWMNWVPFCDYVWARRAVLRRRKKKEAEG